MTALLRWALVGLLSLACLFSLAHATTKPVYPFNDLQKADIYLRIVKNTRCMVCQNQTLADSNAALAKELRDTIYHQVNAGKSHDEIVDFLVLRYGDYVTYKPPFNRVTWLLWLTPIFIISCAVCVFMLVTMRRSAASQSK